jgi:hypothetical protein
MDQLLDVKQADVTGDGIADSVYLYGKKPNPSSPFAEQIMLVIQNGRTLQRTTVPLKNNAGYNARLFLGDFTKDSTPDILVSIDTGGSGGYGIFYLYSYQHHMLYEVLNSDSYNQLFTFLVYYQDYYKVSVQSPQLNVQFIIDISTKGYGYLLQYYDPNGKLKQAAQGEVLAIGGLFPIATGDKAGGYDLLAIQRIIGTTNADTLGYVENLLTWDGKQLVSSRISVAIEGTNLV